MTAQIAVKLPDELLAATDRLVASGRYASRSEVIRRGIEAVVAADRRAAIDAAYRIGYGSVPETAAEMAEVQRLSSASIAEEPWEPWW